MFLVEVEVHSKRILNVLEMFWVEALVRVLELDLVVMELVPRLVLALVEGEVLKVRSLGAKA